MNQSESREPSSPGPVYHNIPLLLEIDGSVDVNALTESIVEVISRHEVLRTNFRMTGEGLMLLIRQSFVFNIERHATGSNGADWGGSSRQEVMKSLLEEVKRPFNLETDLLIRGLCTQTAPEQWLLAFVVHHIVADNHSLQLLAREMFAIYGAIRSNTPVQLPELQVQFSDFAQWERSLDGEVLEPVLFYWKKKLQGQLQPLEMPVDCPRTNARPFTGHAVPFDLPSALTSAVNNYTARHQISKTVFFLGAFKMLLQKYTGQEEIIVGTHTRERTVPGTEAIVGPVADLLLLRSKVDPLLRFDEFAAALSATVDEAHRFQPMPFEKLVEGLGSAAGAGRNLFPEVLFQYEQKSSDRLQTGELSIRIITTNLGWGRYDVNLAIQEKEEGISGVAVFNSAYYRESTIARFVQHYQVLLESICTAPGHQIKDLECMTGREKDEHLLQWNATRAAYPSASTIHQLFEVQAERTPARTAIVYEKTSLTYKDLRERVDQVANFLRAVAAVQPNDLVGILLDRSERMVVGILGVLKSGAAYVPIDPGYPAERINYILQDSRCAVLITDEKGRDAVREAYAGHVITFSQIESFPEVAPRGSVNSPDDLAYVLYTSGTTGQPKGCMITHRNVVRLLRNDRHPFDFNENDTWILAHSFCFDVSVWEMFGALLYGGKLVIPSWEGVRMVSRFLELIKSNKISVLNQTPAAFYALIEEECKSEVHTLHEHLRYVNFAGDKLRADNLRRWVDLYPPDKVKLVNLYGITETTVHSSYHEVTREEIYSPGPVSLVGTPLPETTMYLLDKNMHLVPVGVVGEIYVGGSGVARGYLGQSALTAQRFLENPYKSGEIIYKSGDLAKRFEDGSIGYISRNDFQVKVRGYRIEMAEIEVALKKDDQVREAIVGTTLDPAGNQCLVAYITGASQIDGHRLRMHLKGLLPNYMVPDYYVQLDRFPLTHNGKVDRTALPAPSKANVLTGAEYVPPGNPTEEKIVKMWETLLIKNNVSTLDNFFDIGGNSLTVVMLHAMINESYPGQIEIYELFSNPTVQKLAVLIQEKTVGNRPGHAFNRIAF